MIAGLRVRGFQARHIAQEHSYVQDMWRRLTNPDLLIYLAVSYPVTLQRRKLDWNEAEYQIQLDRLQHARQHADLIIDTDPLRPEQVIDRVIAFVNAYSSPSR